jgi:hypothetical protein
MLWLAVAKRYMKSTKWLHCWTTERGGGVNQLLPCLNNNAYLKPIYRALNDNHNNARK